MTEAELIAGILDREQGYQQDPRDTGNANQGATNWGITAKSWGIYKGYGRQATRDEMKAITREQATEFYRSQYLANSIYKVVAYEPLRVQLIDFAINSGTARATRWLQRVLNVEATGVMDDRTKLVLARESGRLVNLGLVAARSYMIDRATDHGDINKAFEEGLESRALSFCDFVI